VRIVSWNVNSIRARVDAVLRWIDLHQPDVMLIQETKCIDDAMPFEALAARGFELAHHGVDHWNGVAIASRVGLTGVGAGFRSPTTPPYDEARLITATCGGVECLSIYVPNGRQLDDPHYVFKLEWLRLLAAELATARATGRPVVAGGDFNVAPTDLDIYDPRRWRRQTHASPPERRRIGELLAQGFVDIVRELDPSAGLYTWWSYRPGQFEANRGLRIDLLLIDEASRASVRAAWVDRAPRSWPRPSDHAPVVVDLDPATPTEPSSRRR
jgi:exodeoxyribonuclease III